MKRTQYEKDSPLSLDIRKQINKKILQKAYFLQGCAADLEEKQAQNDLDASVDLPPEFYQVLGKILNFVESIDEKSKKD